MDAIVRPRAIKVSSGHCGGGWRTLTSQEYHQRPGVDYCLCKEACVVAVSAAGHKVEVHGCSCALGPDWDWAFAAISRSRGEGRGVKVVT